MFALSGGKADITTVSGGTEIVSAGGIDLGMIVSSGAEQDVFGSGPDGSSSGGLSAQPCLTVASSYVFSGANTISTVVNAGDQVSGAAAAPRHQFRGPENHCYTVCNSM